MLQVVKSIACPGVTWVINSTDELDKNDIEFISNYSPKVYWHDIECKHWCFDRKLPSGKWLENITPTLDCLEITITAKVI